MMMMMMMMMMLFQLLFLLLFLGVAATLSLPVGLILIFPRERMRVCPEVSGLAAWSENWKWYSSLPLGAVVSLFCESV
jgi:hypothetical protein